MFDIENFPRAEEVNSENLASAILNFLLQSFSTKSNFSGSGFAGIIFDKKI